MLGFPIQPNAFTLSSVIKACSELYELNIGRCFHSMVIMRGFDSNIVVCCALIHMYGWNQAVEDARKVFDELPERDDVYCWTAIISTFTRNDMFKEALNSFYVMHRVRGLVPDGFTFGTVLTACANLGLLRLGKEIHAKVVGLGFGSNVVVEGSLLDMYGKCGSVRHSRILFDRLGDNNNFVSWTAMLGVYCQNKQYHSVLDLVRERGVMDFYAFGIVLRACSGLAAVNHGKEVHCKYVRKGGWKDVIIESALVDLYAKCGIVDFAHRVFASMEVKNLITWNSMISGFAQNGRAVEALMLFEDMIKEGIKPDSITFVAVLFACSHAGLVDEGKRIFALMGEFGIKPSVEHYNCMIDLLGRAEFIEEAECWLDNADCRYDKSLLAALLGACTKCSDYITAERIAKKMIELEPDFHLSYVLLGNIYKEVGRWDDAVEIRKLMVDRGVKKLEAGKSWIDSDNQDGSHVNACTEKSVYSMQEAV
jgi:pentatricopeptide repeat protein